MPGDPRPGFRPEVLLHKPQTKGHLVDDSIVVCAGFVIHAPATIDKLQLAILNQLPNLKSQQHTVLTIAKAASAQGRPRPDLASQKSALSTTS